MRLPTKAAAGLGGTAPNLAGLTSAESNGIALGVKSAVDTLAGGVASTIGLIKSMDKGDAGDSAPSISSEEAYTKSTNEGDKPKRKKKKIKQDVHEMEQSTEL